MSGSLIVALAVIAAALVTAAVIGVLVHRRAGVLREVTDAGETDTSDLGLSRTGPTIVHFSAVWCGPCAAVRRVVNQICADLGGVAHVEIDMDINPAAARRLSVLSLPTTFIFDADGRQRYRTAGVPRPADLRAALQPLLASPHLD
jgi:thiol-disulfide isomerase/thioredoxin